jgi:hypothetical protein
MVPGGAPTAISTTAVDAKNDELDTLNEIKRFPAASSVTAG